VPPHEMILMSDVEGEDLRASVPFIEINRVYY
jgi:hypothetical protein